MHDESLYSVIHLHVKQTETHHLLQLFWANHAKLYKKNKQKPPEEAKNENNKNNRWLFQVLQFWGSNPVQSRQGAQHIITAS